MMNTARNAPASRQRGAATLIVVMVIFFIVSLVAAYASRNLIFEQKTSANQYRSTQAFDAAEAGLEWAQAMLNGGRIDAACNPSANVADTSFRDRYLDPDPVAGTYTPKPWVNAGAGEASLWPSCVRGAAGWTCSCPVDSAPALANPAGAGAFPAFRLRFVDVGAPVQPGAVRVQSIGCTRLDDDCLNGGQGTAGEAAARVSVVLALSTALPTPPSAAMTVRGAFDVAAANTGLRNVDNTTGGLTLNTGGNAPALMPNLATVPGSPSELSVLANDTSLSGQTAEQFFTSLFRMSADTYRSQPALVTLSGCAVDCSAALDQAVKENPGRAIWVNGDLTLLSNIVDPLGTVQAPVVIGASGNINFLAPTPIEIFGLVYSQAPDWNNSGSGVVVHGAMVAEGNFIGSGAPTVEYDRAILERLRLLTGSLVRVPGSWRDFF